MGAMVMPSADILWSAVSSNVTDKGIEEKAPKTEEEWKAVRSSAVTIMEASDLILIPGRHVAAPGEKEQDPDVNLSPEKIEALITVTGRPVKMRMTFTIPFSCAEGPMPRMQWRCPTLVPTTKPAKTVI
jgi:hypothetical protein